MTKKSRPIDIEAEQQERPGQPIGVRIAQHEGQGERPVKGKICRNVEVTTKIRLAAHPCHGPIQPVCKSAGQKDKRDQKPRPAKRQQRRAERTHRCTATDGREEVEPKGERVERECREDVAEQRVERVPGRVGDGEESRRKNELARVATGEATLGRGAIERGGGETDEVSEVPSSDDLRPRSPNLGPAGDGDSFRLEEPLVGL